MFDSGAASDWVCKSSVLWNSVESRYASLYKARTVAAIHFLINCQSLYFAMIACQIHGFRFKKYLR